MQYPVFGLFLWAWYILAYSPFCNISVLWPTACIVKVLLGSLANDGGLF